MKLENPLEPLLNSSALSPAIMQSMYANPDKVFICATASPKPVAELSNWTL